MSEVWTNSVKYFDTHYAYNCDCTISHKFMFIFTSINSYKLNTSEKCYLRVCCILWCQSYLPSLLHRSVLQHWLHLSGDIWSLNGAQAYRKKWWNSILFCLAWFTARVWMLFSFFKKKKVKPLTKFGAQANVNILSPNSDFIYVWQTCEDRYMHIITNKYMHCKANYVY